VLTAQCDTSSGRAPASTQYLASQRGAGQPRRKPTRVGDSDAAARMWSPVPGWQPISLGDPGAARVQRRVKAASLGPAVQHGSVRNLL
jgi:hypothetical protein